MEKDYLLLQKFLSIMKLSVLQVCLVAIFSSFTFAKDVKGQEILEKKVTIQAKAESLKKVLSLIEKTADVRFMYSSSIIPTEKKITLSVENEKLSSVLEKVLSRNQLNYEISGQHIVISKKKTNVSLGQSSENFSSELDPKENASIKENVVLFTITGTVTDETNSPIIGASVMLEGTKKGTTTNEKGYFNLQLDDSEKNGNLVISFVGYDKQVVPINNRLSINVSLKQLADLDEVVVVGYGTQKKVNLTGAVSQVTSEVLANRPVMNVAQALQGAVPNLNINIANGNPNTSPTYNIRGGTSFSGGAFSNGSPLILVDGVEMNLNQLNPEDIESISVLKDAASAAVYGSRAAFGVMLVTTKKGKLNSPVKISYTGSYQLNSPTATPNLLDALTIQDAAIQAAKLENRTPSTDMLLRRDKIAAYMANPTTEMPYFMDAGGTIQWIGNTRPYDLAIRSSSPVYKHNLSLRGGSDKNSYYLSLGMQDQQGLYKINNDRHKRYNLMTNVNTKITNWLELESRATYNNTSYSEPVSPAGKGGWWRAMAQEPNRNINMPIQTPASSPAGVKYTDNILSFMDYGSRNKINTEVLLLGLAPKIHLTKNWQVQGNFSYQSSNYRRNQIIPELQRVETNWNQVTTVHTNPSSVENWNVHENQYAINLYSDYYLTLNNSHDFHFMAGYNQESYDYRYVGARGEQLVSPFVPVISQTKGQQYAYDAATEWALRGVFYRVNYNFKNKYLVESNGRYDATSRFAKDSRFKFYPSVSAGWRVSEEPFAKGIKSIVNELKLRASYGSLGNQNVSNYAYISNYGTIKEVSHIFGTTRGFGVTPPSLTDPDLTWETATTLDMGVDVVINKKLEANLSWYQRNTSDILVAAEKLPAVLGTGVPLKNSGTLQTRGFDLTVKWHDKFQNGIRYDITANLSDYISTVTKFNGNPNNLINTLYVGRKSGEIWGYETVGIFQSTDEIATAPDHKQLTSLLFPGDIQYKDLNGDAKISQGAGTLGDPGDLKIIGNNTPRFQFGVNSNVAWKNIDLNIFLQGVAKRDFYITDNMFWGGITNGTGTYDVYNNSWTPERTDAYFPAYKSKSSNTLTQTRFLQNAAYLRLKNISIGYTFPKSMLKHLDIDNLRVYAAGLNLLTFTKVTKIFDPEMMSADYPMIKTGALGVQIGF